MPRALFTRPFPPNLITVPACGVCNGDKAKDDDYLRDWLVCDIHAQHHPTAQALFNGKVLRAHGRNQSQVTRLITTGARVQPWYTPAGVYLGDFPMLRLKDQRVQTILERIVRGLYFDAQRRRMPNECDFRIRKQDPWDFKAIWRKFRELDLHWNTRALGDVFACGYVRTDEDPFFTLWLLVFYGNVCFSVETERSAEEMPA